MIDMRTPFQDRLLQRTLEGFEIVDLDARAQHATLRLRRAFSRTQADRLVMPSPGHRDIYREITVHRDGTINDRLVFNTTSQDWAGTEIELKT